MQTGNYVKHAPPIVEGGEAGDGDDVGETGPAGGLDPVEEPARQPVR